MKIQKQKIKKKKNVVLTSGTHERLPDFYFKLLIETENKYYSTPTNDKMEYLIYLYQKGIDYYTIEDITRINPLLSKMGDLIQRNKRYTYLRQCNYFGIKTSILSLLSQYKTNIKFHEHQHNTTIDSLITTSMNNFNRSQFLIKSSISKQIQGFNDKLSVKRFNMMVGNAKKSNKNNSKKSIHSLRFSSSNANEIYQAIDQNLPNIRKCHRFQTCTYKNRLKISFKPGTNNVSIRFKLHTSQLYHFDPVKIIEEYWNKFYFCYRNWLKAKTDKILNIYDQEYREKTKKFGEYSEEWNEFMHMCEGTGDELFSKHIEECIHSLKVDNEIDLVNWKVETEKMIERAIKEDKAISKSKVSFEPLNWEIVEKALDWFK